MKRGQSSLLMTLLGFASWGIYFYLYRQECAALDAGRPNPALDRETNERIRAAIRASGVVSNPGALVVRTRQGYVTLSGDVFWSEANDLMSLVRALPGIKGVSNRLRAHESATGVPNLQGRPFPARGETAGS